MSTIPLVQRITAILWPSFITAGIATVLFTTAYDPAVIFDNDNSRLASYTICFFLLWTLGAVSSATTCYFLKPCEEINKIVKKSSQGEK